jgi:hypothetical protein
VWSVFMWFVQVSPMGHSVSSEPNFQHSDPKMKLSICEAKIMNSFGDFFKILKRWGLFKKIFE